MALIQFEKVSVSYGAPSHPVLSSIDLSIEEGEFVCLLGQTGCGKSTLLRLVLGSEQPCEGRVLIDDVDIRDYDPTALRGQIGGMFQDYVTYQATAAENIGLGNLPTLTDRDAVIKASRQAGSDALKNDSSCPGEERRLAVSLSRSRPVS